MTCSKNMQTKIQEAALEAHIQCCPYMTAQIGEPIDNATPRRTAKCGLGNYYCSDIHCYYITSFKDKMKELISSAD